MVRALTILGVLGVCSITGPGTSSRLHAQTAAAGVPLQVASRIVDRSRERAIRWAEAAPTINCLPAPLTEHPGSTALFSRPRIAPLEEAFLDALLAKHRP